MTYFHIRYNIYEKEGSPVEKEKWMMFEQPTNDFEVKQYLENEHGNTVSIIISKVICQEEFEMTHQRV